ncbi:glyoxylase-like metal-dependent hydrolase (beta-lactamase superfamily II) [Inhella inkyongensis]|uniref:Glyoxylase-like metal-dependent hydrolase (Beta-lactamase superfamily II) n=1 Tax=Inhella inkyongensis TaxID=392593 RepID=A0A840S9N2_9BURK|nr:MBL fold metallo-hydrolase [Inhella inkyongensis]MBB5206343.1 glyoxylase-like metal-dependent hydrolase (beta-lactamase superfamily II) [Inhella inkyongensis]
MLKPSWHAGVLAAFFLGWGWTLAPGLARAEAPIWDGNKVQMQSLRLAPGAFAHVPADAAALNAQGGAAATSGGLIVGTRGALLIETMLNRRLHDQVRQLAAKAAPGKPLLYAVNTSSHGDHSFGNMFLPRETRLIQHEHTAKFIAEHLEQDKAFMLQHFGKGRGIEPIRARAPDILLPAGGKLVIDLGERQVEIHDFGFAQTGGDLWVWDPQSKTMWAGNPVIAARPALPWLLDGKLVQTLATLQKVYDFLPAEATVVPGHGVPMGREALRWHLDYLSAVKQGVQGALARGLTLEQTVAEVKLTEFRGYALFDWVHPGLNVPAAYKDLSAK